jgi:hypothetical protein
MTVKMGFIALMAIAATSSGAMADCRVMGFQFYVAQSDSVSTTGVSTGGSRCRMSIRAGSTSEFTSVTIAAKPAHGSLTELRAYRFNYQPTTGFRGVDRYAIRVCGKNSAGAGCSTITYNITIE